MRSVLLLIVYRQADAIKLAQLEKDGPAKPSRPPMLSPWMETQKPCCQEGWEKVVESSRDLWPAHSKAWQPVPIMLDAFPDGDNNNIHIQLARNQTSDLDEESRVSFKATYKIEGHGEPYTGQCKQNGRRSQGESCPRVLCAPQTFFLTCPVPPDVSKALSNHNMIETVLHKTRQPHDGDTWVPPRLSGHTTEYPAIHVWQRLPVRQNVQKPFLTACTIARADELASVKNWTSYMHLVGVDHVFVYMVDRQESSYDKYFSDVGSARFITLVPWPFQPGGFIQLLSQYGAYDNCMWRQKRWATWVLQAQSDEYIQPLGKYRNLKQLLVEKSDHSSVQTLETGWFKLSSIGLREGPHGLEASEAPAAKRIGDGPPSDLNVFAEEFSYRAAVPYGVQVCEDQTASDSTCKAFLAGNNFMHFFVRPDDLVETDIHGVREFVNESVVKGFFDPWSEARINHFAEFTGGRYKEEIKIERDCQGFTRENTARAALLKDSSMSVMRACVEMLWGHGHLTPEVEACVNTNWQRSEPDRIVMHRDVSDDSIFEHGVSVACDSLKFDSR